MINWQMQATQFGALWDGTGLDRYPFPFDIVSTFVTPDDAQRYEHDVRAAFAGPEHERLRAAVGVLAHPEVHVAVTGRTVDDAALRVIGAQSGRFAAIAVQQPGADEEHGGDVILGFGAAGQLGAQIVGVLPPNVGGHNEFHRSPARSDDGPRGFLTTATATRSAPLLEQVLADRHAGNGAIRVKSGPRYGRQLEVGRLRWIDIAGDGRYVIGPRDPNRAVPTAPDRLTAALDRLVQVGLETARDDAAFTR